MKNFIILDGNLKVVNIVVAETKSDVEICINNNFYTVLEIPEFTTVDIGFIFNEEENTFYNPNITIEETPIEEETT